MNRCALALTGLLALPLCAAAQTGDIYVAEPHPRQLQHSTFAVTPFAGARLPFTTGAFFVFTNDGQFRVEQEREGAYALGVNGEARLNRALGVIAGVAYSGAGQDVTRFQTPNTTTAQEFQIDGPSFWFAKAGISWRLPDPIRDDRRFHPSALITVAPAMVVTNYGDVDGFPALSGSSTHFAVNLAADAMARLGRGRWAITLGLEDYITFWNTDELAEREAFIWSAETGEEVAIDYDYRTSNIFLVRVGVSFRP